MGQFDNNIGVKFAEAQAKGPVIVRGFGWAKAHPWVPLDDQDWTTLVKLAHLGDVEAFNKAIQQTPAAALYAQLTKDEQEAARLAFAIEFT